MCIRDSRNIIGKITRTKTDQIRRRAWIKHTVEEEKEFDMFDNCSKIFILQSTIKYVNRIPSC